MVTVNYGHGVLNFGTVSDKKYVGLWKNWIGLIGFLCCFGECSEILGYCGVFWV